VTVRAPLVIGVGNPYRRDDGVGNAVVARLRSDHATAHVDVVEEPGDCTRLIALCRDRDLVVIVDAAVSGAPAGTLHRVECRGGAGVAATSPTSSHGIGVGDAINLADALGALPRRLVLYAVEAAAVGAGVGLSPPVARAVGGVVDAVLAEVGVAPPVTPASAE